MGPRTFSALANCENGKRKSVRAILMSFSFSLLISDTFKWARCVVVRRHVLFFDSLFDVRAVPWVHVVCLDMLFVFLCPALDISSPSHQSSYLPSRKSASEKWHNFFFTIASPSVRLSHISAPQKSGPNLLMDEWEREERERWWALLTRLFRGPLLLLLAHPSPCKWHFFCWEHWDNVSYLFSVSSNKKGPQ